MKAPAAAKAERRGARHTALLLLLLLAVGCVTLFVGLQRVSSVGGNLLDATGGGPRASVSSPAERGTLVGKIALLRIGTQRNRSSSFTTFFASSSAPDAVALSALLRDASDSERTEVMRLLVRLRDGKAEDREIHHEASKAKNSATGTTFSGTGLPSGMAECRSSRCSRRSLNTSCGSTAGASFLP
jgi:hypothetical protein